jgi:amino acid transporter
MGDEVKDPGRVVPRSIIISIVVMMIIYLALNVGVLGAMGGSTSTSRPRRPP